MSRSNEFIEISEVEDGMESSILFWYCKISGVETVLQIIWKDCSYGLFLEKKGKLLLEGLSNKEHF